MNSRVLVRMGYELFAKHIPSSDCPLLGGLCRAIRYWFACRLLVECGKRVNLERGATVSFGAGVRVGTGSGLGLNCEVEGPIIIGRDVLMAPEVLIFRKNQHVYDRSDISIFQQGQQEIPRTLRICDDVWLGRRSIILPRCERIGRGVIVGAGSVVTKDIPDYSVVAGNPARIVKRRTLTHDPSGEPKLTLPSGVFE